MDLLRDLTGGGIDTVFGQPPDPARRVSFDHGCFVIGLRVSVRVPGCQHGADDAGHLVGYGDGGALIAPAPLPRQAGHLLLWVLLKGAGVREA